MLPGTDNKQHLLEDYIDDDMNKYRRTHEDHTKLKPFLGFLFLVNMLWSIALFVLSIPSSSLLLNDELRKLSTPSPLFDVVDLKMRTKVMDGGFNSSGSIYRQGPSEAVDKAWTNLSLENHQFISITAADIVAAGRDPAKSVRWNESEDAFPAQVEFSHKIHCLNEVRKEIWGEHYFGAISIHSAELANDKDHDSRSVESSEASVQALTNKPMQTSPRDARMHHREHAMHCLHMLLQDLMCNVDVGIITHEWALTNKSNPDSPAYPEGVYSTRKQCKSFDAAATWMREHAVPDGIRRFSKLERILP